MTKGKTISTRWTEWTKASPIWARIALISFIGSILGLGLHLWVLEGFWRTWGLLQLIGLASCTQTIMYFEAKKYPTVWWWFWFHTYVVAGVIFFEISSFFCSKAFGF